MVMGYADPFETLFAFQRALENHPSSGWLGTTTAAMGTYPPINVFQQGDDLVAIVELPGSRADNSKKGRTQSEAWALDPDRYRSWPCILHLDWSDGQRSSRPPQPSTCSDTPRQGLYGPQNGLLRDAKSCDAQGLSSRWRLFALNCAESLVGTSQNAASAKRLRTAL
jgi:hypothetical protein